MKHKIVSALALAAALSAQATVIDFDTHTPVMVFSQSIVDSGFAFTLAAPDVIGVSPFEPTVPVPGAFNGTPYLHFSEFGSGTTMTMKREDGAAFLLESFDLGLSWYVQDIDVNATPITVTLELLDGSFSATGTTLGRTFKTLHFDKEIAALHVSMNLVQGGYLSLDNFVIGTAVPEPASLALAGLALAGVAASRRRRSA